MATHVEHSKRRKEILQRAVSVFETEGYAGTTFQKIADACGISRTILYLYYPNKKAIFRGAIQAARDRIAQDLAAACSVPGRTASERLEAAMDSLFDALGANERLLRTAHEYLILLARDVGAGRPSLRFRAQTASTRRVLRQLVADVVASGEFHPECNPKAIEGILFALLETAGLRLALLGETENADLRESVHELVLRLSVHPAPPS
ncbi:MAG: TetR/AcrR family transcriptional regulator [Kiritimatiellia bacterium]|jgi:AcrR family transcriptional regulator